MTTTVLILDDNDAQYDLTTSASGSYTAYIPPGATGTWSWIAELYSFQRQEGTFTPATGGTLSINPNWSRDTSVTVATSSTVSAYTTLNNLDELYDYSCYVRTQDPFFVVLTAGGGKISTTADIIVDATASQLWDYDDVTDTLTIKSSVLAQGTTLTSIETTGTITTLNGAIITSIFTDSSGTSSKLTYTGLVNSTLYLKDNTGTQQSLQFNKTGTYVEYIPTSATGTWNWIVESYGYNRQTAPVNFAGGNYSALIAYIPDSNITEPTLATVEAYASIDSLNQLYDYAAYMRTQEPEYVLATRNGTAVDFGSVNIVLDSDALVVWDYDHATTTLTIKSTTLAAVTKFTTLLTTGTITILNDSVITSLYTSSTGPSARLNYSNLTDTTILTTTNTGAEYDTQIDLDGTHTNYFGPGLTGTYNWVAERYSFNRQTGSFTPGTGGDFGAVPAWIPDINITETTQATVVAYTSIDSLNQLYDYAAYMRTQEPEYVLATRNGTAVDFGSVNIVLDSTASSVWSYNHATTTLTIKSTTLVAVTRFTTLLTTGTITLLNSSKITALYVSNIGPSARLNYSNLNNSTILTNTNTGAEYDKQVGLTGTLINYFIPGLTGIYSWAAERYGFNRQSGFFTPGAGGDYNAAPLWIPDANITQTTTATVAGYTSISTVDQLYDYAAYMRTQEPEYVIASKNGTVLDFGAIDLIFDSAAAQVWDYDPVANTLTINTTVLSSGTKMIKLNTTGTITINASTTVTALHSSTDGNSARLNFTNLNSSTLYIIDDLAAPYQSEFNKTGTFTSYFAIGETGTWSWYAERYGFNRQTGIFSPALGGDISALPLWISDTSITQSNSATVAAYTQFDNVDEIYDYAAYMRTQEPAYVLATKSGTTIDFGNTNIIFDSAAATIWNYDSSTNTLTLKTTALASANVFIKIKTTGLITIQPSTYIAALYSHSGGNSARVFYNDLIDSSVLTLDNTGTAYDMGSGFDDQIINIIDSGKTGTWSWNIERYGYRRQTGTFLPAVGGDTTITPIWTLDSYITQATQATVEAYTTISTLDQLYDLAAHMRTVDPRYVILSTSGTTMNLGATDLVLDATASSVWNYDPVTDTLTIKATTLNTGVKSTQILTTGVVSFANGASTTAVYTDSVGTSTNFTITNIPVGSSLYIENNLGVQVRYMANTSASTIITYIPPGQTGNWVWTVEKYGNVRQSYIFTPGGGIQSSSVIAAPDVSITELVQATTAAYPELETADKLYDYVAYYRLSNAGIKIGSIATRSSFAVDFGTRSLTIDDTASSILTVTSTLITVKAPSMSAGSTFTRLSTSAPGLITSANSEPINLKISDALGARATISGLDTEGFGNTWYMRYKLSSSPTYTYISGTGNGVNLLVANGTYSFEVREPGYEWTTMSLDTTNSLDLNMNLQYHKASDDTPQWNKGYDAASEAIFSYDALEMKVAVNNVTGALIQENFAEMYRAMQRIMHLPNLVWTWTNPVRAIAATQTIIIPTGNPIAMFLTPASDASVRITCQIVHAIDGTIAFDRVQGNASGYAIFLGTSQASEIASLRTDIVADIVAKIGGTGFVTATNSLVSISESISDSITLAEIEASTVLAKETTTESALAAARLAAALSA